MAIKASNQITIVDVTDAYSALLSSEGYTFVGNTIGAPSGLSCTTQVTVYCGSQQCSKVGISTITCPIGITATISDNDTSSPSITFITTDIIEDTREALIPILVDEITINKKFTFSVAKQGADGKGIKSAEIRYQISESGDTPPIPTDTWLESIPETTPEKPYLWTRTVIRYTDDTISTSYSVSSTLNGIDIGGRNLISEYNFTLISSSDTETSVTSKTFVINSEDADTITIAVNAAYDEGDTSTKTGAFTVSVYNVGTDGNVGEILVPEVNLSIDGERHSCTMNVSEKTRNILAIKIGMSNADISAVGTIINFSNLKIEKGNQATDWTPSPEDTEDAISEIRTAMSSQKTDILSSCESIILSALETYVESGEYDEFKQTVSSQLEVLANRITMTFSTVSQQVNDVDDNLQTKFNELYKYITFSGENAITIGSSDSAIKLIIDNDQIFFTKDGVTFGFWDGNNFHTGNIIVDVNERAQFGNFAFLPNNDGSLSFVKVGD